MQLKKFYWYFSLLNENRIQNLLKTFELTILSDCLIFVNEFPEVVVVVVDFFVHCFARVYILMNFRECLNLVSAIFYRFFAFPPNDSPSKTMKSVFYFIKKALFVLEIFKLL